MTKFVSRFVQDESGATAIEYGLIAALIAVFIIGAVGTVGTNRVGTFDKVSAKLGYALKGLETAGGRRGRAGPFVVSGRLLAASGMRAETST